MKPKKDSKRMVIILLLTANLCATAVLFFLWLRPDAKSGGQLDFDKPQAQYVIYIGTNDKDTYKQIIPTDKARDIVNSICAKYVEGYTETDARGGWVDESGTLTKENTLVYSFNGVKEKQITTIMKEALKALNQNSILVERRDCASAYYSGDDK